MRFFIDTAKVEDIKKANDNYVIKKIKKKNKKNTKKKKKK